MSAPLSPLTGLGARLDSTFSRGLHRITSTALAPYQAAVVRIGFALTFTLFLLREWTNRSEIYGDSSPWSMELARRLIATNNAFTVLIWSDSRIWFEVVYHGALLAAVLLLLGWRTRTSSVLFMIGVLSLQNRSVFLGDGGDNVIHLMAIYLVFTRCGLVWSLDARRQRRAAAERGETPPEKGRLTGPAADDRVGVALWVTLGALLLLAHATGFAELPFLDQEGIVPMLGWGLLLWGLWALHGVRWYLDRHHPRSQLRGVFQVVGNLIHNGTMLVIVVEVCLIYSTAGWYKIQGSRWQDGTASYYPFNLDYFNPWPELTGILASSGLVILLFTYGTVMVQVAFPFTLFNRRVKNVLLVLLVLEHAGIAVLMGLPFFSMAMISADAVFLPTAFLLWTSGWARHLMRRDSGTGVGAPTADAPAKPLPAAPPQPPLPPIPPQPPAPGATTATPG